MCVLNMLGMCSVVIECTAHVHGMCMEVCSSRIIGRCEYMCNMFYDRHMVNSMHFMICVNCVYSMHVCCMYVVVI